MVNCFNERQVVGEKVAENVLTKSLQVWCVCVYLVCVCVYVCELRW